MKILIVSQYFWPEEFLINDFALDLCARNHEVEVLTGLPNYPSGNFFNGYGYGGPYHENYQGIPVWRSPLFPRGNASGWRLVINYVSFALLACMRSFLLCRRPFDIILVYEVSPITVGIPARMIKALSGARMFFWVQDLWPETLSGTGAVRSQCILRWVGKLTQWTYQGCDRILIQSQAFHESVIKYGAKRGQIRYFPNCAEDLFQPVTLPAEAPERHLVPEGFRVMFAGNIGKVQDFETILAAAELTRPQPKIQWVIVGDGRHRPWVEEQIRSRALTNVHLLGRYPKERMPFFFSLADVMLVSLKHEPIFSITIPSKIQAYLACGKAILASLDGEGARIIREAQAGLTVPAETPDKLADAVLRMAALDPESLQAMGRNARTYYESHFSRAYLLDKFEGWLHEYCGNLSNG
jgi:glycosyltransferase involved in cell wall biosynthesis